MFFEPRGYPLGWKKRRSNHVLVFLDTGFYFVVGNELVSDHSPVLNLAAVPFFVELGDSEIEHFKQCVFAWEGSFFGNLAEAGVDALNRVCGIHHSANSAAVVEQLLNMAEIAFPDIDGSGILRPLLAELLKRLFTGVRAGSAIDFFKRLSELLVILAWDIFDGITDQMYHTSLNNNVFENRFSAFLKP